MKETEKQGVDSWENRWKGHAGNEQPDLGGPSLWNDIDELKIEFLRSDLPANGCAVEVGCGSARLLARVGHAAPLRLYAVDNSQRALDIARATSRTAGIPIECVRADAERLPFASGSVSLVLSGGLLEHFRNPGTALSEMTRILRPGGVFYADVPRRKLSLYRWRASRRVLTSPWTMPGVYESRFGPRYYRRALERLGCAEVKTRSCGVYFGRHARELLHLTKWLDGTPVADLLGWYFMIRARRAP